MGLAQGADRLDPGFQKGPMADRDDDGVIAARRRLGVKDRATGETLDFGPRGDRVPDLDPCIQLGEMGREMLLGGQRAVPAALLEAGFQFRHHTVGDALSAAVGS